MEDDATACAKDLASLFGNKDEVDKLVNLIYLMQGKDVATSDLLDEVESFSKYWVRTVQLGFLILGFLRDEIMAMGSVLFEQADPTITIQSKSFATPTPTPLPAGTTTFYPLGGNYGYVYQIIPGNSGDFWFATHLTDKSTNSEHDYVGHMSANGTMNVFSTFNSPLAADTGTGQGGIALGSDGAVWATEPGSPASNFQGSIERVTASGLITPYPLPSTLNTPYTIVAGPDGALWFTNGQSGPMNSPGMIGRITTSGSVSEYPLPQGEFPAGITVGPDGALWFSYNGANDTFSGIARMNTGGQITTSYTIPSGEGGVSSITSGPDGALWVEAYPFIERVTTGGASSQFQGASGVGAHFAFAPNGNLWDSGVGGGASGGPNCRLTQLSTSGQRLQSFPLFPCTSGEFTFDSNGNIWIDMQQNGVAGIGRIVA